ncbi:MAG TPA: glycosyltransferase [Vicinamibacterales bacterium]|nr:glycosyltransferase [Vicinamibacterales bacterium]
MLPLLIQISTATHYELYHDWRKALEFCRALPDAAPREPATFHMFWRERSGGWWPRVRRFGRKQALPVKAFLATQDLARCSLTLWSDGDLSGNEWLQPFLPHLTLRVYDAAAEARGTALEAHADVYRQRDSRVYRDGDLFRIIVLHNYGGVYADMDTVLLRNLGVFLDQEFVYQWDHFDDRYAPALMRLYQGSAFARALVDGLIAIKPGKYNWGRENVKRAIDLGHAITVFPSPFFNTEWQANPSFEPFRRSAASDELYDGAFAWHWHNKWDDPIEPGCKFERLEAVIDRKLRARRLLTSADAAGVAP